MGRLTAAIYLFPICAGVICGCASGYDPRGSGGARQSGDARNYFDRDPEQSPDCAELKQFAKMNVLERQGFCQEVYVRLFECADTRASVLVPVVDEIPVPCAGRQELEFDR